MFPGRLRLGGGLFGPACRIRRRELARSPSRAARSNRLDRFARLPVPSGLFSIRRRLVRPLNEAPAAGHGMLFSSQRLASGASLPLMGSNCLDVLRVGSSLACDGRGFNVRLAGLDHRDGERARRRVPMSSRPRMSTCQPSARCSMMASKSRPS